MSDSTSVISAGQTRSLPESDLEASDALKALLGKNSQTDLAKLFNCSTMRVSRLLSLQDLVPELRQAMSIPKGTSGHLATLVALELSRVQTDHQLTAWNEAKKEWKQSAQIDVINKLAAGFKRVRKQKRGGTSAKFVTSDETSNETSGNGKAPSYKRLLVAISELQKLADEFKDLTVTDFQHILADSGVDLTNVLPEELTLKNVCDYLDEMRNNLKQGRYRAKSRAVVTKQPESAEAK